MKTFHRSVIVLSMLVLSSGCVSVGYVPINNRPARAARAPQEVEVFLTRTPDRSYRETAILEVGDSPLSNHSRESILERLVEAAGERGCEGLVIAGTNESVNGFATYVGTLKSYRAACIEFTDGATDANPKPDA